MTYKTSQKFKQTIFVSVSPYSQNNQIKIEIDQFFLKIIKNTGNVKYFQGINTVS